MIPKRLVVLGCACTLAVLLWPAQASAQRRGVVRRPARSVVVVNAGFYRPAFYRPYFYDPFFYDSFFWTGWGFYPMYPGYYGAPYGYGYGYYGRIWAEARIQVKPSNARVYLDGYYVGVVDQFDGVFQRLDVPPGQHEVEVYLEGYRTYRERTLFRPGQGYHFKGVLEPLPAGTPPEPPPQPSSSGPDPYRQMYQQPYGAPPPERRGPEPGRTVPLPERRGGEPRPGEPRAETATGFGTLAIRVQPADAVVTIDGERWDSPEGGSRLQVQLSGGRHRIEVQKEGYRPYSTTVDIRPGDTQSLNISLPPGH